MYPRTQTLQSSGNHPINCYAFSPTERYLAIALANNTIDLYEKDGNEWKKKPSIIASLRTQHPVSHLCFSEDENFLIFIEGSIAHFSNLKGANTLPYFFSTQDDILAIHYKNNTLMGITRNGCFIKKYTHGTWAGNSGPTDLPLKNIILEKYIIIVSNTRLYIYHIKNADEEPSGLEIIYTSDIFLKHIAASPCEKYLVMMLNQTDEIKIFCLPNKQQPSILELRPTNVKPNKKYTELTINKEKFLFIFTKTQPARFIKYDETIKKIIDENKLNDYIFSYSNKIIIGRTKEIINIFFVGSALAHLKEKEQGKMVIETLKKHNFQNDVINFSPNDTYLVIQPCLQTNQLTIISLEKSIKAMTVMNSPERISGASCSTDNIVNSGKLKASAMSQNQQYMASIFEHHAEIRELSTNKIIKLYELEQVECCAFSQTSNFLAIKCESEIIIFSFNFQHEKQDIQNIPLFSPPFSSMHISNDNNTIIAITSSQSLFSIKIKEQSTHYITSNGKLITSFLLSSLSQQCLFFADNKIIRADLCLNDIEKLSLIIEPNFSTSTPQGSPHTPRNASTRRPSNSPLLLPPSLNSTNNDSAISFTPIRPFRDHSPTTTSNGEDSLFSSTLTRYSTTTVSSDAISCFSPDGHYLAIYRGDSAEIFETHFGRKVQCITHTHNVSFYEFSPCSHYLAIISDKILYIYSIAFGTLIQTIKAENRIGFCKFYLENSIFLGIDDIGLIQYRLNIKDQVELTNLMQTLVSLKHNENSIYFNQFYSDSLERQLSVTFLVNGIHLSSFSEKIQGDSNYEEKLKVCLNALLNAVRINIQGDNDFFVASFILSILHQAYIDALTSSLGVATQQLANEQLATEKMPCTDIIREKVEIDIKAYNDSQNIISFMITSKIRKPDEFTMIMNSQTIREYVGSVTLKFNCLLKHEDITILNFPILNFSSDTPNDVKSLILDSMIKSEDFKNMIFLTRDVHKKLNADTFKVKMNNIHSIADKIKNNTLQPKDLRFDVIKSKGDKL